MIRGTVNLQAKITDDSGVKKILMTVPTKTGNKTYVYEDGKTNNTLTKTGDVYSVDVDTTNLNDGPVYVVLRGTDNAGNTRYWNNNAAHREHSFTVDNTDPNTPLVVTIKQGAQVLGCDAYTTQRLITVDWNDDSDANFDHYNYQNKDGGTIQQPTVSEFTGSIRNQDGYYKFRVQAADKAGNVGEWSNWCGITLDRQAPAATTLVSPANNAVQNGGPTQKWQASAASDFDHYVYAKLP